MKHVFEAAAAFGVALSFSVGMASADGTLTIGMTAGDLPQTTGNPDQGFEGYRFVGYNLYDSLVYRRATRPQISNPASPPNGTLTRVTPSVGFSPCARV